MTLDLRGFALTIAGCPYVFTTGGLPAITSTSPLWFGAETDVITLSGWLLWPTGWSERAKPLDGDLDMGACTFRLHDATPVTGVATGYPVLSRLATRNSLSITSTPLAVAATAAAGSITVGVGATVGTIPRWVWCEREAMRVTARVGNVLTVTRGVLGTKAEAHDARDESLPDVFADIPWITRRKVILWGVDGSGVAVVLWIGFAVRSPKLSADGARFDMPCDPLWMVLAQAPVSEPVAFGVYGFGRNATSESATTNPALARISVTDASIGALGTTTVFANGLYPTFESLRQRLVDQLYAQTLTRWGASLSQVSIRAEGATLSISIGLPRSFTADANLFGAHATGTSSPTSASMYSVQMAVDGLARSKYLIVTDGAAGNFLVRSLANAPASWASTTTTVAGLTTLRSPCLRGVVDDSYWLVISTVTTSSPAGQSQVSGYTTLLPRKPGLVIPQVAYLTDSQGLNVCQRVTADHWYDGLRYGASDLLSDASPDDFDWSTAATIHHLTGGPTAQRDWFFDGRVTFGAVVTESCQLFGCTPVTRSGLIAFIPWGWPLASTPAVTALTSLDLIGTPTWLTWEEGLANRIKVTSDELIVDATDSGSLHRYGPGRQLAITLLGRDTSLLRIEDPILFSRQVLARMSLWADPLGVARITVSLSRLRDLELGSALTITDWVVPNGLGDRGLAAALGTVVAREIVIDERGNGHIVLDCLLFPRVSYGYAPCGRVASLPAADTVRLSATPVQGTTGYSGGADAATFVVADEVELVLRDSTVLTTEAHTVLSVGATDIQFIAAVGAGFTAAIGAGDIVDLRSAHYATPVQTAQGLYMYIADDTTGVIDGTADLARPIAP